jgi:hypothetical protein
MKKSKSKKRGGGAKYAPLIPFIPIMRVMLRRRGVNPKGKRLKELVELFKIHVLKKSKNFEIVENFTESGEYFETLEPVSTGAAAAGNIVSLIIEKIKEFIKKKRNKKEKDQLDKEIEQEKKAAESEGVGGEGGLNLGGFKLNKNLIFVVLAVAIGFMLLKKK